MPNETKNETKSWHPKAEELKDDQLDQAQGGLCMNEVIKDIVSPRDPASGLPTGNFIGTTVEGTNI